MSLILIALLSLGLAESQSRSLPQQPPQFEQTPEEVGPEDGSQNCQVVCIQDPKTGDYILIYECEP